MKVYVVTTGEYSDYAIKAIFLDKDKAENYAQWIRGANPVKEYDTADDKVVINERYVIYGRLTFNGEDEERLFLDSYPNCEARHEYTSYIRPGYYDNAEEITICRIIDSRNFDKERCENKIKKSLYDLKARVLNLKAEGYNSKQIECMVYSSNFIE